MALETQTVSLNIATSIDQKADDKQISADKLAVSQNVRILKKNRVQKRFGRSALSTTQTQIDPSNPVTIGTDTNQSFALKYDDKTVLYNKGAYYLRDTPGDRWTQRKIQPLNYVSKKSVVANSSTYIYQHTAEFGIYRITLASNDQTIDLSVFNTATQQWAIRDQTIRTRTVASTFGSFGSVKVVPMATDVALLFVDDTVFGAKLTLSTMTVGTVTSLIADTGGFDAVYMTGASNAAKLAIVTRARTRTYDDNLVYASGVGELATSDSGTPAVFYDATYSANRLYILRTNAQYLAFSSPVVQYSTAESFLTAVNVAASITLVLSTTVNLPLPRRYQGLVGTSVLVANYQAAGACLDPRNSGQVVWFIGFTFSSANAAENASELRTFYFRHNVGGTVTPTTAVVASFTGALVGRPAAIDNTVVAPVIYQYDDQSQLTLGDFYRGETTQRFSPIACLEESGVFAEGANLSFAPNAAKVPQELYVASGHVRFYSTDRLELINTQFDYQTQSVVSFDVSRTEALASVLEVNRGLYVSGSVPVHFDGLTFGELGFLTRPHAPAVSIGNAVSVLVTQQGTASLPEITRLTLSNGGAFPTTGAGMRAQFYTPGGNFYLWWNTGSNTDPTGVGTGIEIVIGSLWTAAEIKAATISRVADTLAGLVVVTPAVLLGGQTLNSFLITNAANGVVTDADAVSFGSATGITAGTYQVRTVYKYVNQRGQVFRSSPSLPTSFAYTSGSTVVSLIAQITDCSIRDLTLNEVEFYMTAPNGSIFFLVATNSQATRKEFPTAESRVALNSVNNPAGGIVSFDPGIVNGNRTLYITGGVLENDYPTNWDKATVHRGRMMLGFPDSDQFIYSKTLVPEEGVSFSEFLTIEFDLGRGLTAVASVDEKLIGFTEMDKRVVVGDPANDLGAGSSFSVPQLISSDTGAISQSSIVENSDGVYYKSLKGIYRLSRALQDEYIGNPVEDFNSFTVAKACVNSEFNEIVFVLRDNAQALVYNYLFGTWTTWTNSQMDWVHPSRELIYCTAAGKVWQETRTVFKDVDGMTQAAVPFVIEMPWLKVKGQQDYQRVKHFMLLGELKSAHTMQAEIWWDYDKRDAVKQTLSLASNVVVSGTDYADSTYQMQFSPWKQKCESIKIRFTDVPDTTTSGESCTLNAVDFRVGIKQGLSKIKEAKQT